MKAEDIRVGAVVRLLDTSVGWAPSRYNRDLTIVGHGGREDINTVYTLSVKNNIHDFKLVVPEFDIIRDTWFIRTPTQEDMISAQKWLFSQGLIWRSGDTKIRDYDCHHLSGDDNANTFGFGTNLDCIDAKYEITLRTVMDVQLTDHEAIPRAKNIASYEDKIKVLNDELVILQAELDKLKQG